jgi:hypothetical protein
MARNYERLRVRDCQQNTRRRSIYKGRDLCELAVLEIPAHSLQVLPGHQDLCRPV